MKPRTIINSDNITAVSSREYAEPFVFHKPEKRNIFGKVVRKEGYYKVNPFGPPNYRYDFIGESKPEPRVFVNIKLHGSHEVDIAFRGDAREQEANLFMSTIIDKMKSGERFLIVYGDGLTKLIQ